jgi:hypothetical protein
LQAQGPVYCSSRVKPGSRLLFAELRLWGKEEQMLGPSTIDISAAPSATLEIMTAGIVATLATDLWQRLLQTIASLPPPRWDLVGRWVAWIPRGVLNHRPITTTPPVRGEAAIGWAFHYAVGIVYAALYLAIMRLGFLSGPSLISALSFAIALLRGALAHLATGARHGLFRRADAEPCRGSHRQRVSARSLRARPLPRRRRLTRRGGLSAAETLITRLRQMS